MNPIAFKELKEEDLPDVRDIYNYYVLHTTVTFNTEALTADEMREIVMSGNERYRSYVIVSSGNTVGYVLLARYKKRQAYDKTAEVTIYLRPDAAGKGIGPQALAFIERVAQSNGFHALIAVICTENERSEKLFEKHGYSQCAHFKEIGYKFGRFLDIACYQKIMA